MKLLSLRQPWAWAVMHGGKRIENRKWNTNYRGQVAIHASKGCGVIECAQAMEWMLDRELLLPDAPWPGIEAAPRGGIVGLARVYNVIPPGREAFAAEIARQCSRLGNEVDLRWWDREQFGFVLVDVTEVPFVPAPGSIGLFDVPHDVLQRMGPSYARA